MRSIYLPTIDHPPWFCLVLLVVFIPLSIWHQAHWNRTLAEYAALRRAAGASEATWPSRDVRFVLSVQPWLVLLASAMLAMMVALGAAALAVWPHRLTGFDEALNYFDRPYLAAMLLAGIAALIGAVALAVDLMRSPWQPVASRVRRATHAPLAMREAAFAAALKVDPGVPRAGAAAADRIAP